MRLRSTAVRETHAVLAAAGPRNPVSRPSFCRFPPGMRCIHLHKWQFYCRENSVDIKLCFAQADPRAGHVARAALLGAGRAPGGSTPHNEMNRSLTADLVSVLRSCASVPKRRPCLKNEGPEHAEFLRGILVHLTRFPSASSDNLSSVQAPVKQRCGIGERISKSPVQNCTFDRAPPPPSRCSLSLSLAALAPPSRYLS